MATVTSNELSLEKTLEELVTEFNALHSDVSGVTLTSLLTDSGGSFIFEGSTEDASETTLTVVDPTADRTITLPDATGTVVTTANADAGATTTTFADLDQFLINDGGVLKKMALSTFAASLPALTPASANANALGSAALEWSDLFLGDSSVINFGNDQDTTLTHTDGAGLTLNSTNKLMFNDASQFIQGASATILDIAATDEIELTATLIDVVGNLAVSGTLVGASTIQGTTITATTAVVPDASDGAALGTSALEWSDLFLADGAIINFGDDQEVTLTHVHNDGIIISSTDKIMFNTTSQFIHGVSDAILDIAATDEIELTATLIDVVGNFAISGTVVGASTIQGTTITATTAFVPDAQDGAALGTTSLQFSDLFLADSAVIGFGDDNDTTLTHTDGAGLTLNSTNKLMFNDASQFIQGVSATALDIAATDEIELTATLIDVVGNLAVSGTLAQADTVTMATNKKIQFRDTAIHISSTADGDLSIAADDEIDITSTLIDINGNVTISGTTGAAAVTTSTIVASGIIKTDDTTAATSTTDGSLQTDGGLSVALDAVIGDDLFMLSDAAVITFGAGKDVTLTHVHDTGILLNSTMAIQFNDASQFINAPSNAILDINATDEIELNATLVDINANVEISGNLTVSGTTIQVDTITMNAANAIIFEGATADTSETTLTIVDPTADRTINLPDQSGTVAVLAAASNVAITSTPAELNKLDGATVVVGEINALDLGSTAIGIGIASKAVVLDTAKDYTGIRNLTITGEIDAATGDFSGVVDVAGATTTAAITASGIIKTDDSTAATSTTDGSLQTDGGLSVVLDAVIGDDIIMISDAAQIAFGANSEITLAHVHDVGLTITHVTAGDNLPVVLQLKSEEDVVIANEVIASIEFAAGDSDGTDGATVAAGIHAIAEGTFSGSANATKLVFTTGVSETAASSATAKMTLSSAGLLTLADDLVLKNSATIGAGNDTDLLTLGNGNLTVAGTVTATAGATLLIKNAAGTTLKTIKGMT